MVHKDSHNTMGSEQLTLKDFENILKMGKKESFEKNLESISEMPNETPVTIDRMAEPQPIAQPLKGLEAESAKNIFQKYEFPNKKQLFHNQQLSQQNMAEVYRISEEIDLAELRGEKKDLNDTQYSEKSKILITLQQLSVIEEYPEMISNEYNLIVKSFDFWLVWICLTLLYSIPLFMSVNVKTIGL